MNGKNTVTEKIQNNRLINKYTSKKGVIWILYKIVRAVIVIGICFMIIYPFLMKFIVAFMSEADLYDPTVRYLPRHFSLENIQYVLNKIDWLHTVPVSLLLCVVVTLLTIGSCTTIAYGFARFDFWGNKILFAMVIFTLIVPPQTMVLAIFMRFKDFDVAGLINLITGHPLNLLNTYVPFILMSMLGVGFRNGLYIFLLRQYFRGVPRVLDEAAAIDGASTFRIFVQIILPGAVPMMVTVGMFAFAWQWTDTFYSSLLAPQSNLVTVVMPTITAYMDQIMSSMVKNTGTFLLVIPLILLYIVSQRFMVEGIERSGIVG